MTHADKLQAILTELKLTPGKLASTLGILPQRIYQVRDGRNKISSALATRMQNVVNVSYRWLLNDEGPMFLDPAKEMQHGAQCDCANLKKTVEQLTRDLNARTNDLLNTKDEVIRLKDEIMRLKDQQRGTHGLEPAPRASGS